MTLDHRLSYVIMIFATGCAATSPSPNDPVATSVDTSHVAQVDYQSAPEEIAQPLTVVPDASATTLVDGSAPAGSDSSHLTLSTLEGMALTTNPAVAQATLRIESLRGKWVQAGLPPNPSAGYVSSEIGDDGTAGQQGGYVGQQFITAHKLRRDQAVVAAEIERAEQQLVVAQRRVQTDIRKAYYAALMAQRRVLLAQSLLGMTTEAVVASRALVEAQEGSQAGLLQTEVQQQTSRLMEQTALNTQQQTWRRLSALTGGQPLAMQPLDGDIANLPNLLDWEEQLTILQSESPEVAAAVAQTERSRRALNRAQVEAVPDISTQFTLQKSYATGDTLAGAQIGIPLPLWNRNQGEIRQAQADVREAQANVQRVQQNLGQRLADVFRDYATARATAENYATEVLPRSQRTLDLVRQGYQQGEVGYLELLAAQQTYVQTNLAYLDAVSTLWESYTQIDGMLLDESLSQTSN